MEQARALGADHVIDYTAEDFTARPERYDVIFAVNGYHPLGDYKRALAPGGRFVLVGGAPKQLYQALLLGKLVFRGDQTAAFATARPNAGDLEVIGEMAAAGKVRPIIDRRFPLEQAADAMRYLGAGHARGKVVITVQPDGD
jgi:NADPH:quinone reductase-like Zn-dependent oxidoreductase